MTLVRGLYGAAAAFLAAGFGLRLAPTPLPQAEVAPLRVSADTPVAAAPTRQPGGGGHDAIVAANIFAQDRTAPAVRFVLPGRAAAPPPPRGPSVRLYGITLGAQGAVAIIAGDPKVGGAGVYRLGDLVAGARLVAITDSTVTLAEPSGPLVLRLQLPRRRRP